MKSSMRTSPGWIGSSRSVVVDEFDIISTSVLPREADSPLVVDPDAVLPPSVALERLEAVARRNPQVLEDLRRMQLLELAQGCPQDPRVERTDTLLVPEPLRVPVPE
jgi:hypothetical protein